MAWAPLCDGHFEDGELFLDAAVELAVILVAAAGGEDGAIREILKEFAERFGGLAGLFEVVETEFQESLARRRFAPGVVHQGWNVWQAQRYANARERLRLRHLP